MASKEKRDWFAPHNVMVIKNHVIIYTYKIFKLLGWQITGT